MGKQEHSPKALRALVQDTRTYTATQGQLTQTHMSRHAQLHSCLAYQHTRHSRIPLRAQQAFTPRDPTVPTGNPNPQTRGTLAEDSTLFNSVVRTQLEYSEKQCTTDISSVADKSFQLLLKTTATLEEQAAAQSMEQRDIMKSSTRIDGHRNPREPTTKGLCT